MSNAIYLTLLPSITVFPGKMGLKARRRAGSGRVIFTSTTFSGGEMSCGLRPKHRACLSQPLSHPPGEVMIVFLLGLFQEELRRRSLITASPQVSLACGPEFQLPRGAGSWLLPRQEESTAKLNLEPLEIVSAEPLVTGNSFLVLSTPCRKQQAPRS